MWVKCLGSEPPTFWLLGNLFIAFAGSKWKKKTCFTLKNTFEPVLYFYLREYFVRTFEFD